MKASDYIAQWLKQKTSQVYGVQGGAAVHLFDSCHRCGPTPVYLHHEQAAGFAAVAHARLKGFGVCITTTGPAATNAITPCLGAWQDSIPVLFISGQTRLANVSYYTGKRQIGSQEAPIATIVDPITNHSTWLRSENDLHLLDWVYEAAVRGMEDGRPGPVWLDIPVDIQWAEIP